MFKEAVWVFCVLFIARQASAGQGGGWHQQQHHVPVKYVVKHVHKPVPVAKHVPVPHYVPVPKYIPIFKPWSYAKPVPKHYTVYQNHNIAIPVPTFKFYNHHTAIPIPKPVPMPIPIKIPKPVIVPVPKPVYHKKEVPYPVHVPVPKPVVVPVYKHVPVPIPKPVHKVVKIIKEVPVYIKKPVPVYIEEKHHHKGGQGWNDAWKSAASDHSPAVIAQGGHGGQNSAHAIAAAAAFAAHAASQGIYSDGGHRPAVHQGPHGGARGGGFSAQDVAHVALGAHLAHSPSFGGHAIHGPPSGHGGPGLYQGFGNRPPLNDHALAAAAISVFGGPQGHHGGHKNAAHGGQGHGGQGHGGRGGWDAASSTNFQSYSQPGSHLHQGFHQHPLQYRPQPPQNHQGPHPNHQPYHSNHQPTAVVSPANKTKGQYQVVAQVDIDLSDKNRNGGHKTAPHH